MKESKGAEMVDLPEQVVSWIGQRRYEIVGDFDVERGYVSTSCASVQNGNPLYWDEKVANELTDGWIAPPSMISVWFRPHAWAPDRTEQAHALSFVAQLRVLAKLGKDRLEHRVHTFDILLVQHTREQQHHFAPVRFEKLVDSQQFLSLHFFRLTRQGTGGEILLEDQVPESNVTPTPADDDPTVQLLITKNRLGF